LSSAVERSGRSAHSGDAVIPGLEVSLWEQMLSAENLGQALRRVRANRGAPGVDGMTTEQLVPWLREHWVKVREALDAGTYQPSPVRRVVIPKPGGGERLLGVPTEPANCALAQAG
jgi:RNA-directed DNA polymerase